jgi:hypothetical protein
MQGIGDAPFHATDAITRAASPVLLPVRFHTGFQ